jgi:hypothetical protein
VGKDWAKGRTAATDARIARNAAARRGLQYTRHIPMEQDRRLTGGFRTLALEWSPVMAYVVGLMATDGCLSKDRRHLSFDSNDLPLVETFLRCLGRPIRYRTMKTSIGNDRYQAQFSDVRFYRWLLAAGLTPRKSLTLGAIEVPREFLVPLVRGLLDGDGSVYTLVHAPTRERYPNYRYERLWVHFNSASERHIEWLRTEVIGALGLAGYVERRPATEERNAFFRLKNGNRASKVLLRTLYSDPAAPRLERKWAKWHDYATRHSCAEGGT